MFISLDKASKLICDIKSFFFLLNFQPRACKSRELRSSIMYTSCECIRRNGLQDSCPRSQCQGKCACMCLPNPSCCPSSAARRFANVTMGVSKPKGSCGMSSGSSCDPCGSCPSPYPDPCCGPCGPCPMPSPCGGSYSPPNCGLPDCGDCGVPVPLPDFCNNCACPPLKEGGMPDPAMWQNCAAPFSYPCEYSIFIVIIKY